LKRVQVVLVSSQHPNVGLKSVLMTYLGTL